MNGLYSIVLCCAHPHDILMSCERGVCVLYFKLQKRALEEKVQAGETECVVLKAKLKALDDKPQSRSSEENLQVTVC